MKGSFILSFIFLIVISINATEVNFDFGSMIPSNSVSCTVATCPLPPDQQLETSIIGDVVSLDSDPAVYNQLTAVYQVPRDNPKYIPKLIVVPQTEDDVITAINFARENLYEVSIKNGGHSQDGLSLTERGLQINLQNLNSVVIDASAKIGLVGGGCTSTDINDAGRPFNLAHVGSDVGSIGFSGSTGNGGYGALSRSAGLGVDSVLSVKIVTWEGKVLNVSKQTNEDLFWAVRGSLSNFGVAVLWQIQLHDVTYWYGGNVVYPPESISAVLKWANQFVDNFYFHFRGYYSPAEKVFITQWAHWDPRFKTTEKDAFFESLQTVAPFYVWTVGMTDYYQAQSAQDGSFASVPKDVLRAYGVGGGASNPTEAFFDKFQEVSLGLELVDGMCRFELWGGNITHVAPWATAVRVRESQYLWTFEPNWFNPADDETWVKKAHDAYATLMKFSEATEDCYINYVSPDFAEVCYGDNYAKLKDLKSKYDPSNFFHRNYNIEP